MMKLKVQHLFLTLCAGLLAACTSIQPTYTSTGHAGYRINCGGVFGDGDLGSCYQAAGEACKNDGYRVMQSGVSSMIVECRTDSQDRREPTPADVR